MHNKLILASGSQARQSMLRHAGLEFDVMKSNLDEDSIIKNLVSVETSPLYIAVELAQQKALDVSDKTPDRMVVGGDQVLVCDGRLYQKAATKHDAKEKLKTLSGKEHTLISTVCIAQDNKILWSDHGSAHLTMHDLEDVFLDHYINVAGDALTQCVGAYEFENAGSWLFEKVDGDYFTILGMPLLPLLKYLRTVHGILPNMRESAHA